VTLWDLTGGAPRLLANIRLDAPPTRSPVFSPDGQVLAVALGNPSPRVEIRNVAHHERIAQLVETPGRGDIASYAFSPDGTLLVTGYEDGNIRLWDPRTWTAGRLLQGHTQRVAAVAFSPDGRSLATGGADTTVQLWSTTFHTAPAVLRGDGGAIDTIAFTPDGETLAVGSVDGTVTFWNVRTQREVATIKAHDSIVTSVAFSPDGGTLATISVDQTMRLWKAPALSVTDR
jgi:WD40 repeat protein